MFGQQPKSYYVRFLRYYGCKFFTSTPTLWKNFKKTMSQINICYLTLQHVVNPFRYLHQGKFLYFS
uniref:Uncharacterized protein n=1 Tax=Rhizophora mucronata TaxID=61149 RepID=A0A2P2QLF9_RHIMU